MIDKETYRSFLPDELYRQIGEICSDVHLIQSEASDLLLHNKVPDATAQLNNVLQSTEEATNIILDSATTIQTIIARSAASEQDKQEIVATVTNIFEACNFQDLTGQRIKKVLKSFGTLEMRLTKLSETAKKYAPPDAPPPASIMQEDEILAGPSLSHEAPSQKDIDALFSAAPES